MNKKRHSKKLSHSKQQFADGSRDGFPHVRNMPRPEQKKMDPLKEFDLVLIRRMGEANIRNLAIKAKSKVQLLIGNGLDNLQVEPLENNSHSTGSSSVEPSKSYLQGAKFKKNLEKDKNFAKVTDSIPTRGFALALFRKQQKLTYISNDTKNDNHTPRQEKTYKTPGGLLLDEWQQTALDALLQGKHVIVDAPTSAGKTRVIDALLETRIKESGKLIYTSPVKSLSNDKYREFSEKYGRENVGINTGDFKENLGAPIILATLETYRNSLLGIEPNISRKVVVYDEYHFLQDESRGSAWEESLILTPKGSQLILLSASVPNTHEFAQWIENLTGTKTEIVKVTKRPVPLEHMVYTRFGWIFAKDLKLTNEDFIQLRKIGRIINKESRRLRGKEVYKDLLEPMTQALDLNLGPIVIYAGRRADVEGIALSLSRGLKKSFEGSNAEKLRDRLKNLPGFEYVPPELQKLIARFGIAYHHSGMIPPGRVAIETLLKEGLLRLCCGTMGISLGVNFAVRSAFISDESRPSEGGETKYSNTEIMQMLGRAGRRGHDKQGFSLWLNAGRFAEQRPKDREFCRSSLKFDPTTVIGILGQHKSIAYLSEFYKRSFFMIGKNADNVLIGDHDLISGVLYQNYKFESLPCEDIPKTYANFLKKKKRVDVPCHSCPAKKECHSLMAKSERSMLHKIVSHLQNVHALEDSSPTEMGNLARHFPQAGGLLIANWLANGQFNSETFLDFIQVMACFGAAHFKEIPTTFADMDFLSELNILGEIDKYYPSHLFPELYDEVKYRKGQEQGEGGLIFREFNFGAASLVRHWLKPNTTWENLVEEHSSKYFSAGDCMNVLFRFATFLQSCARLKEYFPAIASEARRLQSILLREPLDARNRMLVEETDEFENVPLAVQDATHTL